MLSRVKEHTRITKSGTKTVKGYDRKKRLKKILAGVGASGLVATGLLLNKNRIKNVLSKVVDVEELGTKLLPASKQTANLSNNLENSIKSKLSVIKQVTEEPKTSSVLAGNDIKLLKGSDPKLLSPAKERLRNTTPGIRNDVITVLGSPETKRERLARLFPTKQKQVEEYISKRKVDTGKKGYLTKAKEELKLADKIEENATTRADLRIADRKRIQSNAQISRSTKRLRELEQTSPLAKSLQRTERKLKRTSNTKIKTKGHRPEKKTLVDHILDKGKKITREELKKEAISRAIDEVVPKGSIVYRTVDDIKSNVKRVERLANDLEKNGDKVSSRRGFLFKALRKTAEELKPKEYAKVARGAGNVGRKVTVRGRNTNNPGYLNSSYRRIKPTNPEDALGAYLEKVPRAKPNLRNAGLIKRGTTRMNRWLQWKSGNTK